MFSSNSGSGRFRHCPEREICCRFEALPATAGSDPVIKPNVREKLTELSPLMLASFLVQASNAAITTMIAIVIARQPGGEQSDVSLIAASYALGFMLGCFLVPKPMANLTRLHGVFAGAPDRPNSKHRALITPAKRGKSTKRQITCGQAFLVPVI
jgi:hypothetical protein